MKKGILLSLVFTFTTVAFHSLNAQADTIFTWYKDTAVLTSVKDLGLQSGTYTEICQAAKIKGYIPWFKIVNRLNLGYSIQDRINSRDTVYLPIDTLWTNFSGGESMLTTLLYLRGDSVPGYYFHDEDTRLSHFVWPIRFPYEPNRKYSGETKFLFRKKRN